MAISGGWRISGSVTGLTAGTRAVDVSIIAGATAVGDSITQSFPIGFTTVNPPATATAALIIPPLANTNALTLKGVTGDTGIPISKTQPMVVTLVAGSTFGILVATGATTLTIVFL